ncbi:MAG TPA: prepilin-type N-terminal cleavage/methylation domain-containing protein [Rhizomicrobium sp.]|nr:prepilin-type N-terminal cleavage/methylation domain-containing protein [Rhizomicrobium sp.]
MTTTDRDSFLRRENGEAGFTLLELLIATTLIAFLSLLLFGGLRFGTRVWEKSETATTESNRIRAAQFALSDEIRNIYPFYAGTTAADKHVDFSGEDKRMTFFAPSKSVPGGMDLVTIQAQPGKDGVSVVIARKVELEGATGVVLHHTVISGLKSFQISYFGSPSPEGTAQSAVTNKAGLGASAAATAAAAPQWTSVWEGQTRLPLLIRVRANAPGNAWSDLVVSPQTEVDESCVLDQTTYYCQGR